MKPENVKTKIFLDSADPKDTESTLSLLGFLDGQTTNPSLIIFFLSSSDFFHSLFCLKIWRSSASFFPIESSDKTTE